MSRIEQALSRVQQSDAPADRPDVESSPADPWAVDDALPASAQDVVLPPVTQTVAGAAQAPATSAALGVSPANSGDTRVLPIGRLYAEKIVGGELPPQVVEEYRRLGAFVHHLQTERGVRVVMVTSAVPGEGKTLTATNLAVVLSGSYGRSVLLIDADLRRPSLHQVFNTVSLKGLGDILSGGESPPLVQVTPRLTLLTAGEPNADPLGGLTSDRMRQLLNEARDAFDFVIIDTPPVGLLTDANLLAGMVDVALLVVRATSTPFDLVKRASEAIGRHRSAGVVLNRAEAQHSHKSDYYTDYYAKARPRPEQG